MSITFLLVLWITLPAIVALTFFLLHHLKRKNDAIIRTKLPPSPPRRLIIGNLHQYMLGKLRHRSLWKLSQEYGPIMMLKLGNISTLVISSPNMAKQVLKVHDIDFCSRPSITSWRRVFYNCVDVAFTPYNDHWREVRKIFVSHLLSPKRSQIFQDAREFEVNQLMDSLLAASPNPVNLDEKFYNLVDGIIGRAAFGKSYGGKQFEGHQLKIFLVEVMELLNGTSAEDFYPSIGWIIDSVTGYRRKLDRCFRKLDGYLEMVLAEHVYENRPKEQQEDAVDVLIRLSKAESGFRITKEHIKAMLMNTFLGGVDTSAVTMIWAMAELMKNSRVMLKLKAEIRGCIGCKLKIEPDDLGQLTYLKMVVKETLRLHPPAPLLIPHESIRQCRIVEDDNNAYDIPSKTRILVNVWAIGRDSSSWSHPDEFWPERFEGVETDYKGMHFEFLPFGAGRRVCPGISQSIVTIESTLANILHRFDWQMPGGIESEDLSLEEGEGLITHRKTNLLLVPIKHKWPE